MKSKYFPIALSLALLGILMTACQPTTPPEPTLDPAQIAVEALATIQAEYTQTAQAVPPTPLQTETPIPSPTAIRTPPALPSIYQSAILHPQDTPRTYTSDTCEYLNAKWDPNNSTPGTVVMVVMIHWITSGVPDQLYQINAGELRKLLENFHEQGFMAITMEQLAGFLETNAKIPSRSVLLLVDDTHHSQYFNKHFRPFYEKYGWHVVNAWISGPAILQTTRDENTALAPEGWIDYQAHGYIHNTPMSNASSDEFLFGELQGSISDLQEHFNKTPIAIIWPGGGFGERPVQTARDLGYRLGFTTNPRGPVMFNWVPQTDIKDEQRPYFIPEGPINDPLMTLPRYIDIAAGAHIDEVRVIGKEAAAYAEQNKAVELEYYDIVCVPGYGPIPTHVP